MEPSLSYILALNNIDGVGTGPHLVGLGEAHLLPGVVHAGNRHRPGAGQDGGGGGGPGLLPVRVGRLVVGFGVD